MTPESLVEPVRPVAFDAPTLRAVLRELGHPRLFVVGDVMLDQSVAGPADRLSQEASVPLLRAASREERLGGAANVARTLACLAADVVLVGVVGDDRAGHRLRRALRRHPRITPALQVDPTRPTTRKRRYAIATPGEPSRQAFRVDTESREPLDARQEAALIETIDVHLPTCQIVLISDYDKGVCTPRVLRYLIGRARSLGLRVLVDPPRLASLTRYRGASCLTPNRLEAGLAAGTTVESLAVAVATGQTLLRQAEAEALLVTLDRDGMVLVQADGTCEHHPVGPRLVRDTTGAGDAVLSVLGICLASGISYGPAVALGNIAGGLEVEQWGVVPLSRRDLRRELTRSSHHRLAAPVTLETRRSEGLLERTAD